MTIDNHDGASPRAKCPFSHPLLDPSRSDDDVETLRYMVESLRAATRLPDDSGVPLAVEGPADGARRPRVFFFDEPGGRQQRVVLAGVEALWSGRPLVVTGFFGHKRPGADRGPMDIIDAELMSEFPRFSSLLSYSTLELSDGNYANMVLWSSGEAIDHWRSSVRHGYASRELAPQYYEAIKIHSGLLSAGLLPDSELTLRGTKRFEFGAH